MLKERKLNLNSTKMCIEQKEGLRDGREWLGLREWETELGWYSGWLAAVSLTEQWSGHFHLFSPSLPLPPAPVQLSLGKCQRSGNGSGFQFFRWHLPWFVRGLQPIVRYSLFFCSFGQHVTVLRVQCHCLFYALREYLFWCLSIVIG